jgi:hypothetical protein
MRTENRRPHWWVLYLILLSAVAVLWLEARTRMSARGHETALILVLLLVFALIEIWRFSDRAALLRALLPEERSGRTAPPGRLMQARRFVPPAPDGSPVTGALFERLEPELDAGQDVPGRETPRCHAERVHHSTFVAERRK